MFDQRHQTTDIKLHKKQIIEHVAPNICVRKKQNQNGVRQINQINFTRKWQQHPTHRIKQNQMAKNEFQSPCMLHMTMQRKNLDRYAWRESTRTDHKRVEGKSTSTCSVCHVCRVSLVREIRAGTHVPCVICERKKSGNTCSVCHL